MEIWKNIEETYGLYQISNCGRIKRKGYISETGKCYKEKIYDNMEMFRFTVDGKKAKRRIDTLVVKYFLCVHTNYRHINHKDFNPQNNHVDNLEVVYANFIRTYRNNKVPIIQYDLDNNKIAEYDSLRIASEQIGCGVSALCNCLNGRTKTCKGYKWGYKNLHN